MFRSSFLLLRTTWTRVQDSELLYKRGGGYVRRRYAIRRLSIARDRSIYRYMNTARASHARARVERAVGVAEALGGGVDQRRIEFHGAREKTSRETRVRGRGGGRRSGGREEGGGVPTGWGQPSRRDDDGATRRRTSTRRARGSERESDRKRTRDERFTVTTNRRVQRVGGSELAAAEVVVGQRALDGAPGVVETLDVGVERDSANQRAAVGAHANVHAATIDGDDP